MKRLVDISIVFIGLVFLVLVLKELQSFLRPLVLALIITLLIMPLFRSDKKIWLGVSMAIILFVIIGGSFFIAGLVRSEQEQVEPTIHYEERIELALASLDQNGKSLLGKSFNLEDLIDTDKISESATQIIKAVLAFFGSLVSELFIVILFVIFLIPSHKLFLKQIEKQMDGKTKKSFKAAILKTEKAIRDYLVTKSLISVGTAVCSMIALWIFGAKFVVILGLLFFLLNFIPNIGSFIAVAIALVIFVAQQGIGMDLVWLGSILITIQIIFGSLLEPKIAGNKLKLSPIIILLSLFFWGWMWGIIGMILAVPLTSIIKIVLEHTKLKKYAVFMN